MLRRIHLTLIAVLALMILAPPALAQERVDKLVLTKDLEEGYQFEAVFQPGKYVLFPSVKGSKTVASFKLHVVSNPSPACFIRGEHNGRAPVDEADRLTLETRSVWRYFELGDTCYLRFEVRDYDYGAVNIRPIKKTVDYVASMGYLAETKFEKGRWSGSAKFGEYDIQFLNIGPRSAGCHFTTTPAGREVGIFSADDHLVDRDESWTFELAETCKTAIRVNTAYHTIAPHSLLDVAFVKS